jgi:hypothetical protein
VVFGALCALAGHRRCGDVFEGFVVVGVDLDGLLFENLLCLLCGLAVPLCQDGRVDVLVEEVFGFAEKFAGDDDRRGRAVAHFVFLGLGDFDNHVRGGVLDVHLVEDGDAVVRDDDTAGVVDEHLVHPFRTECGTDGFGDGFAGCDVHRLCVFARGSLRVLGQYDEGLVTHLLSHSHGMIDCDSI